MNLEITILSNKNQKREISYDITYMQSLKRKTEMNLFTKQKQTHRVYLENKLIKREGGEDNLGVWD